MTDYYPLILKAVSGLEKNTGEARRALYERARTALVAQLRGMTPPLSESEVTRERLALEESIRKIEAEAARALRDASRNPPPKPKSEEPARRPAPVPDRTAPDEGLGTARAAEPPAPPPPPPAPPAPPAGGSAQPRAARNLFASRLPLTEEGLKGFRDVIAEAEALGKKTAQAQKAARETYAAMPTNVPDLDRLEPRVEPEPLSHPPHEAALPQEDAVVARPLPLDAPLLRGEPEGLRAPPEPPPSRTPPGRRPPPRMGEGEPRRAEGRRPKPEPPAQQRRRITAAGDGIEPARASRGLVAALVVVLMVIGLAGAAYWQRDRVAALFGAVRSFAPTKTAQKGNPPAQQKIPDRVGQPAQPGQSSQPGHPPAKPAPQPQPNQPTEAAAQVAQRVVLYEEDPADPAGKRYIGSAIWRIEKIKPTGGSNQELAVRCDVEIPERRMGMTMSLRRNTDQALPASHTIEIMFNLPADFPFGGINNVPGILMKQAEQARGAPISGLAVKVTSGFFLIGLSAVESEMKRNLELLKERAWFDIPIVYNNGRRAILAVEKGTPGDRIFAEAFAAWGQ